MRDNTNKTTKRHKHRHDNAAVIKTWFLETNLPVNYLTKSYQARSASAHFAYHSHAESRKCLDSHRAAFITLHAKEQWVRARWGHRKANGTPRGLFINSYIKIYTPEHNHFWRAWRQEALMTSSQVAQACTHAIRWWQRRRKLRQYLLDVNNQSGR